MKFRASKMWFKLATDSFHNTKTADLKTFRQPGSFNNRLASRDPYDTNSYRYFKNILYNIVTSASDDFIKKYKKIKITNLGNPIEVTFNKCEINLDYVFSIQELIFCQEILDQVNNVVEIGAGFGRTCHAILENIPHVEKYTIIDIPEINTY